VSEPLTRRSLLQIGAATTGTALIGAAAVAAAGPAGATPTARLFVHGVASGDPLPDSVILWTRVTPQATATPGSGRGPVVPVSWEMSADVSFRRIARSGAASAGPAADHTVKVDVRGLAPATTYWYRFRCQGVVSPVGRTRTAPADRADVPRLRMAVVSCANLQAGWFSAYRHLAARRDIDVVVHLGDYLYE
jgi:phosphodiesterase/alkaline phosphatase D-like protein